DGAIAAGLRQECLDIGQRFFRRTLADQVDHVRFATADGFNESLASRHDRIPIGRGAVAIAPCNGGIGQRGAGLTAPEYGWNGERRHAGSPRQQQLATGYDLTVDIVLDKGGHLQPPHKAPPESLLRSTDGERRQNNALTGYFLQGC